MGVREQALAQLAERQARERSMVRALSKRLDAAHASTETARAALGEAEATRAAVLTEWAAQPGWTVEAIAEHTGLGVADVRAAVSRRRASRSRQSAPAATAERLDASPAPEGGEVVGGGTPPHAPGSARSGQGGAGRPPGGSGRTHHVPR